MNRLFLRIDGYGFLNLVWGTLKWCWILLLRNFSKSRYIQRKVYNFNMILDVFDRGLSKQLLKYGARELDHKYILDEVVHEGDFILDIGANIGYYALIERKLIGDDGFLIAIEPSPENVKLLRKNLKLNKFDNTEVYEGAISSTTSKKEFFLSNESNLNTFHDYGTVEKHLSGETILVDTYTIPELLRKSDISQSLDLIRMDVEGHEVDVINGMIEEIERNVLMPSIIFETHISRYNNENNMSATLSKLFQLGYKTKFVGSSWQEGTKIIEDLGYKPIKSIPTDGVRRSIFSDISPEHTIKLVCETGGVRTVYLEAQKFN